MNNDKEDMVVTGRSHSAQALHSLVVYILRVFYLSSFCGLRVQTITIKKQRLLYLFP